MKKMAVFASGTGSNTQKIIDHFSDRTKNATVCLIASNKQEAGVLDIAGKENIDTLYMEKERFFRGDGFVPEFESRQIDLIVLAGFLWKVPITLINAYPRRIINIHPALLPKFGGKGMYGRFVHEAVLKEGEQESGITIHYVDEHYDHGATIFQAKCSIAPHESVTTLSDKIHLLEHRHYPQVIEQVLNTIK
ncbi:MAG TPA: phosphoribosylglycinamide formyltransferase [Chitinophagaceae bacterium]|jgi:phosphoribosylglycinamide formyltransferase-1|nr:phosphoribosylglycinamide formyltransferase [Chitinophagaceae bacterium]